MRRGPRRWATWTLAAASTLASWQANASQERGEAAAPRLEMRYERDASRRRPVPSHGESASLPQGLEAVARDARQSETRVYDRPLESTTPPSGTSASARQAQIVASARSAAAWAWNSAVFERGLGEYFRVGFYQGLQRAFHHPGLGDWDYWVVKLSADPVTSINLPSPISNYQLHVSPNPNTGAFIVEFNNEKRQDVKITLLSITGQVLYEKNVNNISGSLSGLYSKRIDLRSYAKGIYSLQLSTQEKTIYKKIIVE